MSVAKFISVRIPDPYLRSRRCDAIVNLSQITLIVRRWCEIGEDGVPHPVTESEAHAETPKPNICVYYLLYDASGREYDTLSCGEVTTRQIEDLWDACDGKA